jgi:tetratricopeptide (TPR) repeat protein
MRPDWGEGLWYLGTLQYEADQYAQAVPVFQKLVELAPSMGLAWDFLGLSEFETKDYRNALGHLKKGYDRGGNDDPEIARVSAYHLALLLNRAGEFELSSSIVATVFAQSHLSAQTKVSLGLSLLRVPLLPEEVAPSQDALIQAAGEIAALLAQGNTAKALALDAFPSLISRYPTTPYVHYSYGKVLALAGKPEDALAEMQKERNTSPESALPDIRVSMLQLQLGHSAEALEAARRAVHLAPDSAEAHKALSASLQAIGKVKEAETERQLAETLSPEKPRIEARIARLYSRNTAMSKTEASATSNKLASKDFETLARQAAAAEASGETDAAIQNYQQALLLKPEWDEGRWNVAMISYSSGRFSEAKDALTIFVSRKPNNGTAWAVLGLSEFELKDYGNALIHLQRGRELGLGGSVASVQLAKYRLAELLNRSSDFDSASDVLAGDAGPEPLGEKVEFVRGMALLRLAQLPEQVQSSQRPLVQASGQIAGLLQDSKYDDAFVKFQKLLVQYPTAPMLHYLYGTALVALSQYDEAALQMHKEIEISPKNALPYIRLASIALKQHQPAEAIPFAQRAVELSPDSAEAHYEFGRASLQLGEIDVAIRELERSARLSPGSPEVHFNLARAYTRANLPGKAEQERAIFVSLNAKAEEQRSLHGDQSYKGPRDANDFSAPRAQTANGPTQEAH